MTAPTNKPTRQNRRLRRNVTGAAVRRVRYTLGWSQARLALQCQLTGWDVDRFTITRIEAGTRWVGDFELMRLAQVLSVETNALLPATPP